MNVNKHVDKSYQSVVIGGEVIKTNIRNPGKEIYGSVRNTESHYNETNVILMIN